MGLHPNSDRIPGNPEPCTEHQPANTKFITRSVISQDIVFSSGYSQTCYTNQFVPGSINCLTSDLNELSASNPAEFCPQQKYPIYRKCSVPGASSEDWNCVSFSQSFPEPPEHGTPGEFCHFLLVFAVLGQSLDSPTQAETWPCSCTNSRNFFPTALLHVHQTL